MKINNPNSAQKGNMRSAQKKTPASEKKNGKEQTSGKKLIQARLPFKILAATPPSAGTEAAASSTKLEAPPKKRKLSYTEESENPKKIGKCDSKENLTLDKLDTCTTTAAAPEVVEDIILLDDEDDDAEDAANILSPKTPAETSKSKKSNKSTPRSAGSATTPKVLIKLPLSGKKKKRKSMLPSPKVEPDDDVELICDDIQQPTKKVKLLKHTNEQEPGDSTQQKALQSKKPDREVDLNKNENKSRSSPKRKQVNVESANKNKVSPKDNVILSEEQKTNSEPIEKDDEVKQDRTTGEKIKNTKFSEQPISSPKKVDSQPPPIVDQIANDSKCDPENLVTPVRSRRSARRSVVDQKIEEEKEKKSCDEKVSSEPEFVSEKLSPAETSISEASKKLLTPKQIKLMEQRKQVREEKERKVQQLKEERDRKLQEQREDRERKLQEEKLVKQKEREERELQRKKERDEKEEQKRREKEEKEEQRRKEKDDKERKRLAEIEAKNEEKRKKDEAKEEERRKKEDERRRKELEKEEEENRKKKAAQAFTKFFVPKVLKPLPDDDPESREDAESVDSLAFRPFQIKGDMKLAPTVRREFRERSREKLDSFLKGTFTKKSDLYISEIKKGKHIPLITSKTILKDSDDVIIIENELETAAQAIDEPKRQPVQRYKAKFYSFRENRRPPFYGTWRKKSSVITSRRPFATDKNFFDYEVDSDDEWEEEEPGESLNGSDDEKDESEDEDYEVDNEWFVPHGHLSDEEMQNEDELGPDTSREAQKAKLKALQQEFAQEMKKKTEKIKPRLIGAIWEDENGNRPALCPSVIWDSLCTRAMMFCEPMLVEEPEPTETEPTTPPADKQKRIELTDELMGDLVRLVHGNRHSRVFLIKEYMEHVSNTCETIKSGECLAPTKTLIREKIDEISEWSVVDNSNSKKKNKKKLCWVVSADVLDKYSLSKLGLRNEWTYKLQAKYDLDKNEAVVVNETQEDVPVLKSSDSSKVSETIKNKRKSSGITKFAKVLTKEEKLNQIKESSIASSSSPKTTTAESPKIAKSNDVAKTKATQKQPSKSTAEKPSLPSSSSFNSSPVVKKRVALLMSVPSGQQFSPTSKNALISNFLMKNKKSSSPSTEEKAVSSAVTPMKVDELIVLD